MSADPTYPYATYLDIKFPALWIVDVAALVKACTDQWYNQTLCKVNDSVVRLGVMQGEYHWHKHDNDDEFFFVLDGHFIIDLEEKSVDLQAARRASLFQQGVMHRTRAPDRSCHSSWSSLQASFQPATRLTGPGGTTHPSAISSASDTRPRLVLTANVKGN